MLINGIEQDMIVTAEKFHRYFGHPTADRLISMVKNSDLDPNVVKHIKNMNCDICLRFKDPNLKRQCWCQMSSMTLSVWT